MRLAARIPADISEYLTNSPGLPDVLRTASEMGLTADDIRSAIDGLISSRAKK